MGGPDGSLMLEDKLAHASTGNTTAVIVALPTPLDSIRLVGDEDKHATILFFGETSSLPDDAKGEIQKTLIQAARMFPCFSEEIINITRLGSDDPPALVAMLSNRNLGQIRSVLQVNPKINEYLTNAQQFPSYTPHVTLAYPDIQGEMELRKTVMPLYKVTFDRLALWWGDEQVEYPLGMYGMDDVEAAVHSGDDSVEKFLEHHGVKGQKWGVRRSSAALARAAAGRVSQHRATKKAAKAEAKAGNSSSNKPHRKLTDQELQALVNRMRLEQEFKRLTSESAPVKRGDGFIKSLMKETGKNQIRRVVGKAADIAIENALKKHGGTTSLEIARRLEPKKKKD